jgi:hypothetical protein
MPPETVRFEEADELDPTRAFGPGDVWISGMDLLHAGIALTPFDLNSGGCYAHPSATVVLSHVVTNLVLSERAVFAYDERMDSDDPSVQFERQLALHFPTVQISVENRFMPSIFDQGAEEYSDRQNEFREGIRLALRCLFPSILPGQEEAVERGLEFVEVDATVALGSPVRYAPNPYLARALSLMLQRGRAQSRGIALEAARSLVLDAVRDMSLAVTARDDQLRRVGIYDLPLPGVFAAVLRNSSGPGDILPVAAQLREEAKPFVSWCRALDVAADSAELLDVIEEAGRLLDRLALALDSPREERLQIAMMPGWSGEHVPLASSRLMEWAYGRSDPMPGESRRAAFLLNVYRATRCIGSLASEIERVLGKPDFVMEAAAVLLEGLDRVGAGREGDSGA